MKRILATAAALLFCLFLQAQNSPEDILKLIGEGKMVTLEYSLTVDGDYPVRYSGIAALQEGAFLVKGNGMEIYCDGENMIVVDPKAKEIYVEKACSIQEYISNNIGKVKNPEFRKVVARAKSDDLSVFKYDLTAKDSSWIITDIR